MKNNDIWHIYIYKKTNIIMIIVQSIFKQIITEKNHSDNIIMNNVMWPIIIIMVTIIWFIVIK